MRGPIFISVSNKKGSENCGHRLEKGQGPRAEGSGRRVLRETSHGWRGHTFTEGSAAPPKCQTLFWGEDRERTQSWGLRQRPEWRKQRDENRVEG